MFTSLIVSLALAQGGLQVKDIKAGHGVGAKDGDVLTMLYKGTLKDGKVFDQNMDSKLKKPPFAFKLGAAQVIKGWDQGLKGMKVGGTRRLIIPSDLGYGASGAGDLIPANATLTFEVEMLRIDHPNVTPKDEIEVLKQGSGPAAKDGDAVKVHYRGSFINGVEFDNSYDRKEPIGFTLGKKGLITGFAQGVSGMKVGEKRKVTIPYQLAYGERGRAGIPGMATLVFQLELVSIGK